MRSPKELSLDHKLLSMLSGKTQELAEIMFNDEEIIALQDYANTVSIKRLNINDHGPVHMRKVARNAMKMADILNDAGIQLSLEKEEIGTFDESRCALFMAAMLHDIGMTVGRQNHEFFATLLAPPIIERLVQKLFPDDTWKQVILRSLTIECIAGHMGTQKIHSMEAGIILVADGCDMEKGRSRIPILIQAEPRVGDIHQYSSASIEHVKITRGEEKPIRIMVEMTASVGFFQVEEVLHRKIDASTLKPYIELYAGVEGREVKRYL